VRCENDPHHHLLPGPSPTGTARKEKSVVLVWSESGVAIQAKKSGMRWEEDVHHEFPLHISLRHLKIENYSRQTKFA
jgi:hypothetical protein